MTGKSVQLQVKMRGVDMGDVICFRS